jgi:hypothetical protein
MAGPDGELDWHMPYWDDEMAVLQPNNWVMPIPYYWAVILTRE